MHNKENFIDNQDGTITDSTTELMWMQEDAWQKEAKWFTWDEAIELANYFNSIKLGGFQDWRLPTEDEIQTLYHEKPPTKISMEKKFIYGRHFLLED